MRVRVRRAEIMRQANSCFIVNKNILVKNYLVNEENLQI